jgi:hypothetical protein
MGAWSKISGAPVGPGYAGGFAWDPVTKKFYGGHSNYGFFVPRFMDPRNGTSGNLPQAFPGGFAPDLYPSVSIDYDRRLMFVVGGAGSPGGSYVNNGTITYHIDSQTWTNHTPTTAGDKVPEQTAGGGLTYDRRRGLMWWWHGRPDTKSLYNFDYNNKTWTRVAPAGASPAAPYAQGTFNKFRYIEMYDVFVAFAGSTESAVQVWMYKPADWDPANITPPDRTAPNAPGTVLAQ